MELAADLVGLLDRDRLTLEGREALKEHWDRLERIRKGARALKTLKVT